MTLQQLAALLPGYVTLAIHTDTEGCSMTAGMVSVDKSLSGAFVVKAVPLAPYFMEVYIKQREVKE